MGRAELNPGDVRWLPLHRDHGLDSMTASLKGGLIAEYLAKSKPEL